MESSNTVSWMMTYCELGSYLTFYNNYSITICDSYGMKIIDTEKQRTWNFFIQIIFYIRDYILQPFIYRRDNLKHIETPNTALLLLILQVLLTLPQLLSPQMNNKNDSKRKKKDHLRNWKSYTGKQSSFILNIEVFGMQNSFQGIRIIRIQR